jgi:RNA polymerase sigma-70 factor (ECF subfamily)
VAVSPIAELEQQHASPEQTMSKGKLTPPVVTTIFDEDAQLVGASRAGDVTAFEQLVSRYDRRLFRIAYNIVQNVDDANDMVQESFIKVFQNLEQFQSQSKFSTWLYRIVVNQCLMEVRRQGRKPAPIDLWLESSEDDGQLPMDFSDWRPNPEEHCKESELRDLLTRLLQELRPALRVVFIMHDIEGQPLQEVADALELTLAAAKTRSLRARLYLRERLTTYFKKDLGVGRDLRQSIARSVAGSA